MSGEDVAVVKQFTDGLRSGDIKRCMGLLHPDNEFLEADNLPFGGDYMGTDGFIRMLKDVSRELDVQLDEPRLNDAGPFVVVQLHGRFTSKVTGKTVEMDVVDLYTIRDGKVAQVDVFYKDTRAIHELCIEGRAAAGKS